MESPSEQFACNPQATGKDGGHTINLRLLAKNGVVLLGRLVGARGTLVEIASDLLENVTKSDEFAAKVTKAVDESIRKDGFDAPEDHILADEKPVSQLNLPTYKELDLKSEGISTIIWAIGFKPDHSWVDFPVFDDQGYAVHQRGVTSWPGLYFLGLHFQHKAKSDLLFGIGEDAEYIADSIEARS